MTKGTAYICGPAILAGVWLGQTADARRETIRRIPILVAFVLLVNAGYYVRNWNHDGHPLGDGTTLGMGYFKFANDRFGVGTTASNALRGASLQLVGRPSWNESVYEMVLSIHRFMGWDPNDPATTWLGSTYEASRPGNHEATAANPAHLLLLVLAVGWFAVGRRWGRPGWYALGLVAAALLFCFYLRWPPWHARLQLALFIAAAPVFGVAAEYPRPKVLLVVVLGWLLWSARAPLLYNDLRPLVGPRDVFRTERAAQYVRYVQYPANSRQLQLLVRAVAQTGCRTLGIDALRDRDEYPVMGLLLDADPASRFQHFGVDNATLRHDKHEQPVCAVICLRCAGQPASSPPYASDSAYAPAIDFGRNLLFPASAWTA